MVQNVRHPLRRDPHRTCDQKQREKKLAEKEFCRGNTLAPRSSAAQVCHSQLWVRWDLRGVLSRRVWQYHPEYRHQRPMVATIAGTRIQPVAAFSELAFAQSWGAAVSGKRRMNALVEKRRLLAQGQIKNRFSARGIPSSYLSFNRMQRSGDANVVRQ